ncbi:crinkler (CRN) family protein [Thraustotheca clavata]|uniref:Crinkler (CRN) family protein n=1 Tax=Thraustotheca clavata TaxID=74557 RepID=A0A1V9YBN2_9STRA|nr:crinkler (CRN) family protein [Thraustotheca clavata]
MSKIVELRCAVYGEGSVFTVKIAHNATVEMLQKKIADIMSAKSTVSHRLLKLYLTRKDDKWIKDDANLDTLLKTKTINSEFMNLRTSWNLNKEGLITSNFTPQDDIHVLVVLLQDITSVPIANDAVKPKNKLSSFQMMLKKAEGICDLPTEGEFLDLFKWTEEKCGDLIDISAIQKIVGFTESKLYVRKEVLGVLDNFNKKYLY